MKSCLNCGGVDWRLRRDRCKRCFQYLHRTGKDRTVTEPPKTSVRDAIPCSNCGSIAHCEEKNRCRACCQYLRKHGVDRPQDWQNVSSARTRGLKFCRGCGVEKALTGFHKSRHYGYQSKCKACQLKGQKARWIHAQPYSKTCLQCGIGFTAPKGAPFAMYCSQSCGARAWKAKNPGQRQAINDKYNALKRTAVISGEFIRKREIYERDQWKCGICGGAVDKTLPPRTTGAPSLDHIIPLSQGGSHTRANVQLAHHGCNAGKRDGVGRRGWHGRFTKIA